MMFALMAPLIVTGSWTEKMSFEAFLVFVVMWPCIVYYPLVHFVWNPDGFLNRMGVLDFAGGLVIHSATGMAGLVVSYLLQRRKEGHSLGLSHHNIPLSFTGATLVWSGWYSFNGGSAYKADYQAAVALLNTHLSACTASLVWSLLSHRSTGHWSIVGETFVLNEMILLISARLCYMRCLTSRSRCLQKKHEATSSVGFMDALSGLDNPRAFFLGASLKIEKSPSCPNNRFSLFLIENLS